MAIYLKKFETHTQYDTYINGSDAILPNVSICTTEGDVHYNPWVETRLICEYNITDTSNSTLIAFDDYVYGPFGRKKIDIINNFNEIEIDNNIQQNITNNYNFNSTGYHTIKYKLNDLTTIGEYSLKGCINVVNIIIPKNVININEGAFKGCVNLINIEIPINVTYIGPGAFSDCTNMESIIIKSTIPATISGNPFGNKNYPICVPNESVELYKTSNGWSTYADRIQPIQ